MEKKGEKGKCRSHHSLQWFCVLFFFSFSSWRLVWTFLFFFSLFHYFVLVLWGFVSRPWQKREETPVILAFFFWVLRIYSSPLSLFPLYFNYSTQIVFLTAASLPHPPSFFILISFPPSNSLNKQKRKEIKYAARGFFEICIYFICVFMSNKVYHHKLR